MKVPLTEGFPKGLAGRTNLTVTPAVGYATLVAGVLFFAVAGLGLARFPDVYTRLSAVTKAATLGVCLVLVGVVLVDPSWRTAVAVVVAVALQLVTSPVGGFALGRAAYRAGVPLAPGAGYNDLARDDTALNGEQPARGDGDAPAVDSRE